jgi:pyridoxal phosphate enzyme (YggS family)
MASPAVKVDSLRSSEADVRVRYGRVLERVSEAARRAGRDPSEVTVVAIAKTFPAHVVLDAIGQGINVIGESRAQELREKFAVVGEGARWHFVGPLQTNKVRQVVGIAELIHSVDRLGLAEAIARRGMSLGFVQEVLVEVNIARERAKHGADPARAVAFAQEVARLDGLLVRGFMAMAPLSDDPERSRPYFAELAELRDRLAATVEGANHLSMGMSRDFEVGVEEGATLVRVGEAIFGPRAR